MKLFSSVIQVVVVVGAMALNSAFAKDEWEDVKFVSADNSTEVKATLYSPKAKGRFPAILVLHPGGGVSDPDHTIAFNLMKQGYVTLVIDTYGTRGFRNTNAAGGYKSGTSFQLADVYGAFNYLSSKKNVDKEKIGLLGSSRGGHTTIMAVSKASSLPEYLRESGAKPGRFRAGVTFFPHCIDHENLVLEGALLILIGDKDSKSNVKCAKEIVTVAKERKHDAELKVYAGVNHGFTRKSRRNCDNKGWCFNPEVSADAEKQAIRFFLAKLKGK